MPVSSVRSSWLLTVSLTSSMFCATKDPRPSFLLLRSFLVRQTGVGTRLSCLQLHQLFAVLLSSEALSHPGASFLITARTAFLAAGSERMNKNEFIMQIPQMLFAKPKD